MRTEPGAGLGGEAAHLTAFLGYYRQTVVERCASLPDAERRRPALPSGWSPLELLLHLAMMERRWFVWGFLGEPVEDPWADSQGDREGRWLVPPGLGLEDVVALLGECGARTEQVLASTPLGTVASDGGRFAGDEPPDLRWICFHVLQEYARHAGHLDVAVELAGGATGE